MEKMIQEYSKEIWWQKNKTLRNKSLKTKYMYRHFWWAFRNGFFLYFNIRQYFNVIPNSIKIPYHFWGGCHLTFTHTTEWKAIYFVYYWSYYCMHVHRPHITEYMWRSEDNFWELVLSSHCVFQESKSCLRLEVQALFLRLSPTYTYLPYFKANLKVMWGLEKWFSN